LKGIAICNYPLVAEIETIPPAAKNISVIPKDCVAIAVTFPALYLQREQRFYSILA
jgi:hypothetical protein